MKKRPPPSDLNHRIRSGNLKEHVNQLVQAGANPREIGSMAGVSDATIRNILSGKQIVTQRTLTSVVAIEPSEVEWSRPIVDEVLLDRIILGRKFSIPYGEKGMYARKLLDMGWGKQRVATTLGMSGTSMVKITLPTAPSADETAGVGT